LAVAALQQAFFEEERFQQQPPVTINNQLVSDTAAIIYKTKIHWMKGGPLILKGGWKCGL